MNLQITLLLSCLLLLGCSDSYVGDGDLSTLVWSDEFDTDGHPDESKWSYDVGDGCPNLCGWGNRESQFYTAKRLENCRIEDGILIIETHREQMQSNQYTSARLVSKGKGDFQYGKFEIRAKLPSGRGTWAAIWMLPTDGRKYGSWPNSGEIDIMEHVGHDRDSIFGTIHNGAYNHMIHTQKGGAMAVLDSESAFHVYTLIWNTNKIEWQVDGQKFFEFKNEQKSHKEWPFDQPFHLLLNIAVGGFWGGAQGIDDSIFPQRMEIDYIRVYQ